MSVYAHLRSIALIIPFMAFAWALFFAPGVYWRVEIELAPLLGLATGHPLASLPLLLLYVGVCSYGDDMLNIHGWRARPWIAFVLALLLLCSVCLLFAFYATMAILPLDPANLPLTLAVFTGGVAILYFWGRWRLI